MINDLDFDSLVLGFRSALPFGHLVVENFLKPEIADLVVKEFDLGADCHEYISPLENKRTLNDWNRFGPTTYRLMAYLNGEPFVRRLEALTGCELFSDPGLNGGGLHSYGQGGKLNPHLDYSIHPKLGLERRINLLVYITPGWTWSWGGHLGLWDRNPLDGGFPIKQITPLFNRAVLFDTTGAWHGLVTPVDSTGPARNSLAVYYLCKPRPHAEMRGKALFAPTPDQLQDPAINDLIAMRAGNDTAAAAYRCAS
jgi:2OG-Fe(II) oxygenase superfamily